MSESQDIDGILRDWSHTPGAISARLVTGADGREVLQMRIEMGVIQMETVNRPDGEMPEGAETYLDHLIRRTVKEGEQFEMSQEQCIEADREFLQYYHRRICWLALRKFTRAVADADHTLGMMDFVSGHSPSREWTLSHEQYRPFVLFHRTQAAALAGLQNSGPEGAIEELNGGLRRIRAVFEAMEAEEHFEEDQLVAQLVEMKESLRQEYRVGRTLAEQLADAVAAEQYELAADLRDKMARRQGHGSGASRSGPLGGDRNRRSV